MTVNIVSLYSCVLICCCCSNQDNIFILRERHVSLDILCFELLLRPAGNRQKTNIANGAPWRRGGGVEKLTNSDGWSGGTVEKCDVLVEVPEGGGPHGAGHSWKENQPTCVAGTQKTRLKVKKTSPTRKKVELKIHTSNQEFLSDRAN